MSYTYRVDVKRSGYITVESFPAPEVAPTPIGHEHPPRTVADVKALLREKVNAIGLDAQAKRSAREVIKYITRDFCQKGGHLAF